jgi:PAS domain S-box-containing protein
MGVVSLLRFRRVAARGSAIGNETGRPQMGNESDTESFSAGSFGPRDGEFYRTLIEQCDEGIVVFGTDGRIIVWNSGIASMTALTPEQCLGQSVVEVFLNLGVPSAEDVLAKTLAGERTILQPVTFRSPQEQQARLFEANYHPHYDSDGCVKGGAVVVRDVTERAGIEQALLESEQKHRYRFTHSADACLIIDPAGRYIDANPAACALTGYSREELLSMSVPALSVPEERAAAKKRFGQLIATGESRRERVIERKDGTRVDVEAWAIDLGDGTLQTSVRDITVRKRAEEQLHQALQRLQFHVERMPLGYIVWTTEMCISEWNPAAERIFGWSADEARGMSWTEVVPESERSKVLPVIEDLVAESGSSHLINENKCKDGRVITCEWFNTSLVDSVGRVIGVASMVQDVTEREAAESQLRHAQKMESLGVLASGIAHDFGNLLTVVIGNLKMLRAAQEFEGRPKEHLAMIEEAAVKASDLTNHMLTFARTGRHEPEEADLTRIVEGALNLVRGSIGHGVVLETRLDESLPKILVDRNQVEQIVLNLCLNAADAMPEGGTITIETVQTELTTEDVRRCIPVDFPKPGPRIGLIVRDTGRGMPEAMVRRIFDPFYTTKADGHGLGLAAVAGILKQHQAHVVTRSVSGEGTSFHIFFPVFRDAVRVEVDGDREVLTDGIGFVRVNDPPPRNKRAARSRGQGRTSNAKGRTSKVKREDVPGVIRDRDERMK